jgi:hypothetical protein
MRIKDKGGRLIWSCCVVRLKCTASKFPTELRGEGGFSIIYTDFDDDRYDDHLSWTNPTNRVPR